MGVYGYGMNASMYPNGYAAGYGATGYRPVAMSTPMGMNGGYSVITSQPMAVTGYGNGAYGSYQSGVAMPLQSGAGISSYGYSSYGYPQGQTGFGSPAMLSASTAYQPMGNAYSSVYPAAYSGASMPGTQTASWQQSMPLGQPASLNSNGYYPSAAQLGISNPFAVAPSMQPQGYSAYSNGYAGAGNPAGGQFVTRQELNGLLQYVQSLETKQMELETELSANAYSGGSDYSLKEMPPDDASLYLEDPYIGQDGYPPQGMGYDDPMAYGPEPGYPGAGNSKYQAYYQDPSSFDAAYSAPGQVSSSMYNSSPLNQAVAQYRDTMRPEFSMNGELTEDAKSQKDAKENNGSTSGSDTNNQSS